MQLKLPLWLFYKPSFKNILCLISIVNNVSISEAQQMAITEGKTQATSKTQKSNSFLQKILNYIFNYYKIYWVELLLCLCQYKTKLTLKS